MAGLLDLKGAREIVKVSGGKVEILGVSTAAIVHLMRRFPEIRDAFSGRVVSIDLMEFIARAPGAVAGIIAAGCGNVSWDDDGNISGIDPEAQKAASLLSIGDQADLLQAIFKATFPGGFGPFADKLRGLTHLIAPENPPPKPSPKPLTNSQAAIPAESAQPTA